MKQEFTEFREFWETDKSLKHEFGSIKRSCLSHVSSWRCGSILISYTRGGWVAGSSPFSVMTNIFTTCKRSLRRLFLHVSVCPQGGRGYAWQRWGHVWQGCICGRGHAWGACMGGGHVWLGHAWQGEGHAWWGHAWWGEGACMMGCSWSAWQRACMARGHAWWGHAWWGACVAGGMHEVVMEACKAGVCEAGGMYGVEEACMVGRHVWHTCPLADTTRYGQ